MSLISAGGGHPRQGRGLANKSLVSKRAIAPALFGLALTASSQSSSSGCDLRASSPSGAAELADESSRFSSQRYSPLEAINRSNVKNLKLAFSVALGGTSANEYVEATPLVDDGFMYITDVWGVVYKIDVKSGTQGRIVCRKWTRPGEPDRNRGVACGATSSSPSRVSTAA